LDEYQETNRRG
jgi:hypothetical protein